VTVVIPSIDSTDLLGSFQAERISESSYHPNISTFDPLTIAFLGSDIRTTVELMLSVVVHDFFVSFYSNTVVNFQNRIAKEREDHFTKLLQHSQLTRAKLSSGAQALVAVSSAASPHTFESFGQLYESTEAQVLSNEAWKNFSKNFSISSNGTDDTGVRVFAYLSLCSHHTTNGGITELYLQWLQDDQSASEHEEVGVHFDRCCGSYLMCRPGRGSMKL